MTVRYLDKLDIILSRFILSEGNFRGTDRAHAFDGDHEKDPLTIQLIKWTDCDFNLSAAKQKCLGMIWRVDVNFNNDGAN
jgi:hypothetical protein